MTHEGRLQALDALRGLAALAVVVYHDTLRYPRFMQGLPMHDGAFLPGINQTEAGVVPVLWFFLISGFVITWTIDRSRSAMDFVVGRFSRLYPAYWAALAITVILQLSSPLPGAAPTSAQVAVNATMLQEYLGFVNVEGVYWSLAIELLFYAYALALFASGLWRHVHVVVLLWAAAALFAALLDQAGLVLPWRVKQLLLLQFGPFLAAGMALYMLWRGPRRDWSLMTLAVCAAAVLAAFRPVPAVAAFVVAGLIAWATQGGLRWLATPPLLWLGSISYTLYLSHQTASFVAISRLDAAGLPHWASILGGIVVALLLATAITLLVERPALRAIRGAWRRVRRPPAPAAAAGARPASPAAPGSRG